jgi:hypothetical protein
MEQVIEGKFLLSVLEDGKHANIKFSLPPDVPKEIEEWFHFIYCNDIVWRHFAGNLGCSNGVEYFATVDMDLYRKYFNHINGEQYLVPGSY